MNRRFVTSALLVILIALAIIFGIRQKNNTNTDTGSNNNEQVKYFEIPELGIKFPIDPASKGLIYKAQDFSENGKAAYFASTAVAEKAKEVGDQNGAKYCADPGTIGAASRLREFPTGGDRPLPPDTLDFGDFLIEYSGPQDACTVDPVAGAVLTEQVEALRRGFQKIVTMDGRSGKIFEQGAIKGESGYPALGQTPAGISFCGENLATHKIYCSQSYYGDESKPGVALYALYLPAGKYQVYATRETDPRSTEKRHYYMSGGSIGTVEVKNGETVENITPSWQ